MDRMKIATAVHDALASNKPVVALESTVISHGLPSPENLETALACEEAVREQGSVPATVAIIDGQLRIGLDADELRELAEADDVDKLSIHNLGAGMAAGKTGSTTVAATVAAADMAKIRVFATGGIGGVHHGANETGDISADLTALARTDVTVVCSGAKAILDLPRTREVLETNGVTVLGFQTDYLPGFWYERTDLPVDARIDELRQLCEITRTRAELGQGSGVLLCNPPPADVALRREEVDAWISEAQQSVAGIRGKEITPFLLSKIAGLSEGRTMKTNIALLVSNAGLAARAAAALCNGQS